MRLAVQGGATVVQLRDKDAAGGAFLREARAALEVCRAAGVPLLINDRVDVALAVGADGVHVGQDDLPAAAVRRLLGPDLVLGVSVKTPEEVGGGGWGLEGRVSKRLRPAGGRWQPAPEWSASPHTLSGWQTSN